LNVRIQAPVTIRARRLMEAQNIAEFEKAQALVEESDELRGAFIQSWYRTHWDAANAFDLVINTGKTSPELAVKWILEANQAMAEHGSEGGPSTRDLPTDTILAETVSDALESVVLA